MFKLLRYYSVASFVAVLATAILLTWFYRQVAIEGIARLTEQSNLTLARAVMNPIKPALLEFLDTTENFRPKSVSHPLLSAELVGSIKTLMHDRAVVRIKIYNRRGVVVFSTKPTQIGNDQRHNQGFITAINGGVGQALIFRDTSNSFDTVTEEDNLMQTYIPVRASPAEPIQGVFELYTDANSLVQQTERTAFIIMIGAILILSSLYAALVLIVRRANRTIELQQRTIRERTETLGLLSSHMLKSEELHKKKIAFELHEGLAQTLSAAKLTIENGQQRKGCDAASGCVESIIPLLQEAIREARAIATDLRPPSLDDLGLLLTLNGLCRDFEQQHPSIRIERQISLQERDIPAPLKVVMYRIIVSVLDDMARHTYSGQINIALWQDNGSLVLLIDDTAAEELDRTATPLMNIDPQLSAGYAKMEEQATLSGGVFRASHYSGGGTMLRATWGLTS